MLQDTSDLGTELESRAAKSAAEYVRMSTDHQQYSTANQSQAIREYAARHGFHIEKTYEDSGKSGLNLDDRQALKQLIEDVQNGSAEFSTILVYSSSTMSVVGDASRTPMKAPTMNTSANARAFRFGTARSNSRMTAARSQPSSRASNAPWPANTVESCQSRFLPGNGD